LSSVQKKKKKKKKNFYTNFSKKKTGLGGILGARKQVRRGLIGKGRWKLPGGGPQKPYKRGRKDEN